MSYSSLDDIKFKKEVWTNISDRHTGKRGGPKCGFWEVYINLPQEEAIEVFQNYFNIDFYQRTCSCCGQDFFAGESDPNTLNAETFYERHSFLGEEEEVKSQQTRENWFCDHVGEYEGVMSITEFLKNHNNWSGTDNFFSRTVRTGKYICVLYLDNDVLYVWE